MRLTIRQELALKHPVVDGQDTIDPRHIAIRAITEDIAVRSTVTVDKYASRHAVWHISLSVQHRETGATPTRELSKEVRRFVRAIAEEELRGVGVPPDDDRWTVGPAVIHLERRATGDEEKMLG